LLVIFKCVLHHAFSYIASGDVMTMLSVTEKEECKRLILLIDAGERIDFTFLDVIELLHTASYLGKERKLPYLEKAGNKLDLLKFLLQIAWEIKAIDNKKYISISKYLNEMGRMVGGWSKGLQKRNPAQSGE